MDTVYSVYDGVGDGMVVDVQTHLANGLPALLLIGFVGKSLDESRERIRSAFSSSNIDFPKKKITCNIAPSDIQKNGSYFDLSIAASILLASKQINPPGKVIILGELSLDGELKPVRGVLGKILIGKKHGFTHFIIPEHNAQQALLVPDIHIASFASLQDFYNRNTSNDISYIHSGTGSVITPKAAHSTVDFEDVVGQSSAKRALEIAAAGQHNVLLSGPPGVGKSMLAKALISILPPMDRDEIITVTHLHSLVGSSSGKLVTERPLRSPHHSTSDIALIGGGQRPRPGEISLSHGGVLFLDEIPEFKRSVIESLRQPLEDKQVTISRAQETATYPANFLLVATKNPCPCGFFGSSKPCICTPVEIDKYQKKLSGPLMDRIDLHVTVDAVDHASLLAEQKGLSENSSRVRSRVERALKEQTERFKSTTMRNGMMANKQVKSLSELSPSAKTLLDSAAEKLNISARVYMKMVKVARTIADLDGSQKIEESHISEALRYRPQVTS